jgi:hypothetical protein
MAAGLAVKVQAGARLVGLAPGLRAKWTVAGQLARVALAGPRRVAAAPVADPVAELWSDYHLLSFVDRPVNVRLTEARAPGLVAVVPELNPGAVFGGYLAFFACLDRVLRAGLRVDILCLQPLPPGGPAAFAARPEVRSVLERAELSTLGLARTPRLHPGDALLAYNWTTALLAQKMARFLRPGALHYFVQEDERAFYPSDAYRFLAEAVFHQEPRPVLLCNSVKLADALAREGLSDPACPPAVFEQGIADAPLPDAAAVSARRTRRLVLYGRPEAHARRNLMPIALMALAGAARRGVFDGTGWEFATVGSALLGTSFALDGLRIGVLPPCDYAGYRAALTGFDLGLALMGSPHPSVPPFEMVRAGLVTVVNTTADRPAGWYRAVSPNFEPAAPGVDGLIDALARAAARVADGPARIAGARTVHPATWQQAFDALNGRLHHPVLQQVFPRGT